MPVRIALQQAGQERDQALPALRVVGNLQAPEQVVDGLEALQRRFRLLAVAQHVVGDHARPRAGDEATDRRRRAHGDHLVGDALRQMLLQDLASLGDLQRVDRRPARRAAAPAAARRERRRADSGRAGRAAVSGARAPAISSATAAAKARKPDRRGSSMRE